MKQVSIALLGCGTVGKGVIDVLLMNGPVIEEKRLRNLSGITKVEIIGQA